MRHYLKGTSLERRKHGCSRLELLLWWQIDSRPSPRFLGHLCVTISPSPFGRGGVPASPCLAEKDIQINGRGTNHFFMEQSRKKKILELFHFTGRASTIICLLSLHQSSYHQIQAWLSHGGSFMLAPWEMNREPKVIKA